MKKNARKRWIHKVAKPVTVIAVTVLSVLLTPLVVNATNGILAVGIFLAVVIICFFSED